MSRRRPRCKLRLAVLWLAFLVTAGLAAFQWLLPWLARRGELNAVVEQMIRSRLTVPVRIERIETEPLSELRITRLHSVAAEAEQRLRFEARTITLSYDPLQLLDGRIREVRFEEPGLFIDLDAELGELRGAAGRPAPPAPASSGAAPGEDLLPFTVGSLSLDRGALTLRLLGNDLPLSNLQVGVSELGKALGQTFHLSVDVLGGTVRAWGSVDIVRRRDQPTLYAFREARIAIADVKATALLAWLTSMPELGAWLPSVSIAARSTLQLEGSFEGTYPDRVELSLATHALDVSGEHASGVSLRDAMAGIHLCATVLGDLESVKFTISTHAEGKLASGEEPRGEVATVSIEGEFRRGAAPAGNGGRERAGTLTIAPSTASVEGLGTLQLEGSVDFIVGEEAPALQLDATLEATDLAALFARAPAAARRWLEDAAGVVAVGGKATVKVHCGGDAARPRFDVAAAVPATTVTLRGERQLSASLGAEVKGAELDLGDGSVLLEAASLRLEELGADRLAALWLAGLHPAEAAGTLGLVLSTSAVRLPQDLRRLPVSVELAWSDVSFSPPAWSFAWKGANGKLGVQVSPDLAARRAAFALRGEGTVAEALAGAFYASLAGESLAWSAAGQISWEPGLAAAGVTLDEAELVTPLTGAVTARGSLRRGPEAGAATVELDLEAPRIPGTRAFRTFVAEPLAAASPWLGEAAFLGDVSLSASIAGPLDDLEVRGQLDAGPADLSSGMVTIERLEAALPFAWRGRGAIAPGSRREGFLRARRLHASGSTLTSFHWQLVLDGDRYHLEPLTLPLHGGRIVLRDARVRVLGPGAPEGSIHLHGEGLQTASIARAHGLQPIDGRVDFAWDPLRIDGSRLESHGTLRWRAFGGELSFTDLTLDNVTRPYAGLRLAEGKVHELNLRALGETFRFGVASGILGGTVRDLEITAGELTRFRIDVEAVHRASVPQYLNRAAIESIRRVLAGPLGAIEETFFSKFFFRDFGFTAELDGEVFRLRGKYPAGDKEYILRGRWFQLPRIDIVNARPGKDYEWRQIVENLKAVYAGK